MTPVNRPSFPHIGMYSPFRDFATAAKLKPEIYERILRVFQGKESDFAGWREIVERILPFDEVLAIPFTPTPEFYHSILFEYLGNYSLFTVLNAMNSLGLRNICTEICTITGNQFYIDCLKPQWFFNYPKADSEYSY